MVLVATVALCGCLLGCAAIPKTFDEALDAADKAAEIARRQGVAYVAHVEWEGKVRGTLGWTGVIDSGVRASFTFFGNAKAADTDTDTEMAEGS